MKTKKENLSLIRVCILNGVILLLCTVQLMSCGGDDEAGPDDRTVFLGEYEVEESPSDGAPPDEFYDITISNSGSGVEIDNFRFFVVPVKGTVSGMNLTIPAQSFTQGSITIEVSGSGVLADDVLYYTYTLTGYLNVTKYCVAVKK